MYLTFRIKNSDSSCLFIFFIWIYLTFRIKRYFSLIPFFFSFFPPLCQTIVLSLLMRSIGNKNTILLGLGFQILQLAWYGFGSEPWYVNATLISEWYGVCLHFILYPRETLKCVYVCIHTLQSSYFEHVFCRMMWAAGAVAAMSSITFPAVSALVSRTADADQQGRFCPNTLNSSQSIAQRQPLQGVGLSLWHRAARTPERGSHNVKIQVTWKLQYMHRTFSGTGGKHSTGPQQQQN